MALTQVSTDGIKNGTITGSDLATDFTTTGDFTFQGATRAITFDKSDDALEFGDEMKATFGNSGDLAISHSGTASLIQEVGTGSLHISTNGTQITIDKGTTESMANFIADGAVELFYDNSKKFETTSTGVNLPDNSALELGDRNSGGVQGDLRLYHDGSNSYIDEIGAGNLFIRNGSNTSIFCQTSGTVELYNDGSKKFNTDANGVQVTGRLSTTTNISSGSYLFATTNVFSDNFVSATQSNDHSVSIKARNAVGSEVNLIVGTIGGSVDLYHNSYKKFETLSTGIRTNGNVQLPFVNNSTGLRNKLQWVTEANFFDEVGYIAMNRTAVSSAPSDMVFATGTAGSVTTRLCITSDGKVGINTASPSVLTHIRDSTNDGSSLEQFRISGGNRTADSFETGFRFFTESPSANGNRHIRFTSNGNTGLTIQPIETSTGNAAVDRNISLCPNGGKVGIGTTSPSKIIHTSAGNDNSGIRMTNTFDTPDNVWELLPSISGVSNTGFTIRDVTDGRNCLVIDGIGRVSIGASSSDSRLLVQTTANVMVPMAVNDSSNTSTLTHRIAIRTNGTEVGSIKSTNSATQYNTSGSDRTLKKNFESWNEDVLSLFKNINPQKFNFIQEEDGANKSKGFIAQEIANSFPEAYTKGEGENDKYWFNPSGMVVYLMKAIQELETEVAALKAS